jgi:hypothetical protein
MRAQTKATMARQFMRQETKNLSNLIFRLNKDENVLALREKKDAVYYVFDDGSIIKTNTRGSEITLLG